MARFQRATASRFQPSSTVTAEYSYLNDTAQALRRVEKQKFSLSELDLRAGWTDALNSADQLSRDKNYAGAYSQYADVLGQQIKHFEELSSNPNVSESDQLRYQIQISNLRDRMDGVQTRYENQLAAEGARQLSLDKKDNAKYVREMFDTQEFLVDQLRTSWQNRAEDSNGTPMTGETFDKQVAKLLFGTEDSPGFLSKIDAMLQDEDSLNSTDVVKLQNKRNEIIDAIKGSPDATKSDPYYNIINKTQNPQDYQDFVDPGNPGKLYRSTGIASVNINGVNVDLNQYTEKFRPYLTVYNPETGETEDVKTPDQYLKRDLIRLPDPNSNDPQKFIEVGYDPFASGTENDPYFIQYDLGTKEIVPFDPNAYKWNLVPTYPVYNTDTGEYNMIENGQRRLMNVDDIQTIGDISISRYLPNSVLQNIPEFKIEENIIPEEGVPQPEQDIPPDQQEQPLPDVFGSPAQQGPGPRRPQNNFLNVNQGFLGGNAPYDYGFPKARGASF